MEKRDVTVVVDEEEWPPEPLDCVPQNCCVRQSALRWFQLVLLFVIHWLVDVVCGENACQMIINIFGYIAIGQAIVIFNLFAIAVQCIVILVLYSLNAPRVLPWARLLASLELLYAASGILLMLISGILGAWMAARTTEQTWNKQGRGVAGVRPQWIAAAVLEFLAIPVFALDLLQQKTFDYPHSAIAGPVLPGKRRRRGPPSEDAEEESRRHRAPPLRVYSPQPQQYAYPPVSSSAYLPRQNMAAAAPPPFSGSSYSGGGGGGGGALLQKLDRPPRAF